MATLIGGAAAAAVAGLGRAAPTSAAAAAPVLLGQPNPEASVTEITNTTAGGTSFRAIATENGAGLVGESGSGFAVYGYSVSGQGLFGTSSSGVGVYASSDSTTRPALTSASYGKRAGIVGYSGPHDFPSPAKTGVFGIADEDASSVGLRGSSPTGRGGLLSGGLAQLRLSPSSATTHPHSGQIGDLFVDKSGRLWFCKGTTTWKQIA